MDWLYVIFPIILAVWFTVYRINTQELGPAWREAQKRNRISFLERIPFLERIRWEIQKRQMRKRILQKQIYLGKMPEEQGNIYLGNGRFGPYVAIRKKGNKEIEYASLIKMDTDEPASNLDTANLEQAIYSIRMSRIRNVSSVKEESAPFNSELPKRFGPFSQQ